MGIPGIQRLGDPGRGTNDRVLGSSFRMEVLRIWPRSKQVDAAGHIRHFFPRPLGLGNGGRGDDLGYFADPPLFGPVYQGHVVGLPRYGWGGSGYYQGYPAYFH